MVEQKYKLIDMIIVFLLWIGMWNLVDLLIQMFVPDQNYCTKMIIYVLMLIVAVILIKERRLMERL